MASPALTNFEIQKYDQNKQKFNSAYSRNNLSKINDRGYIINIDECESIGTHWIAVYVNAEYVTYFEKVEHIPEEIKKFIRNKKNIENMVEENISQEFRLKNIDETRN